MPASKMIRIKTLDCSSNIAYEMQKVYKEMRRETLPIGDGRQLVTVLKILNQTVLESDLEAKINFLIESEAEKGNHYSPPVREAYPKSH